MIPNHTTAYPRIEAFPDVPVFDMQSGLQLRVVPFELDPAGDADVLELCWHGLPLRSGSD